MNGYNFTERVRKVLALAREEAAVLHHEYVGTEHILLALVREGNGTAVSVLTNLGVRGSALRDSVLTIVKTGSSNGRIGPDLPYTSRAKKTLEFAMSEARELNHSYVGTEHLLLGLLRERQNIGAAALASFGVTLEAAREETQRVLSGSSRRVARSSGDQPPLSAYPQRLREVISDAYEVATERGEIEVTPAHVVIALLEHGDGMANVALDRLNFDRAAALELLQAQHPSTGGTVAPDAVVEPSHELRLALAATQEEQLDTRASVPGTHHLLLAVLRTCPDVAAAFEQQGITYAALADEIRRGTG